MFLQSVTWTWGFAKAQDGGLIGQAGKLLKLGELAVQRRVEERLFHAGVRQGEPLLHEVNAQHGQQRKGWPASFSFWVVRRNERYQITPRHYSFHLLQELAFTGFLHTEIEVQSNLFHATYFIAIAGFTQHIFDGVMQSFLK